MTTPAKRPFREWLAICAAEIALNKRQFLVGAAFATLALAAVLYISVAAPWGPRVLANWGFGPDWDCGNPIKGSDLVCIKRASPKPN